MLIYIVRHPFTLKTKVFQIAISTLNKGLNQISNLHFKFTQIENHSQTILLFSPKLTLLKNSLNHLKIENLAYASSLIITWITHLTSNWIDKIFNKITAQEALIINQKRAKLNKNQMYLLAHNNST